MCDNVNISFLSFCSRTMLPQTGLGWAAAEMALLLLITEKKHDG